MGQRTSGNSIYTDNKVPGPGTYKPKDVTDVTPKFTMKGKFKQGTNFVLHSDGTHETVPSSLIDGAIPGPGTYSASHTQVFTNLSAKFGTEARPSPATKEASAQPAPNAYDRDAKTAALKRNPAFGFGTAKNRPATQGNEYIPGPGTYKNQDITGAEHSGRVILSRYETPKTSNQLTPGPGTYAARFPGQ